MALTFIQTSLPEVILIEPEVFTDRRGFFMETYNQAKYKEKINCTFVQDNHSHSVKNTLRGLHYQLQHPQAKLIRVVNGEIFDVAVDIRQSSPTFGKWVGTILSAENKRQVFIPEGFAHGFCVLSEYADVLYKCSDFYVPGDDLGLLWSDKEIGINWPIKEPIVSDKDQQNPLLTNILPEKLPT